MRRSPALLLAVLAAACGGSETDPLDADHQAIARLLPRDAAVVGYVRSFAAARSVIARLGELAREEAPLSTIEMGNRLGFDASAVEPLRPIAFALHWPEGAETPQATVVVPVKDGGAALDVPGMPWSATAAGYVARSTDAAYRPAGEAELWSRRPAGDVVVWMDASRVIGRHRAQLEAVAGIFARFPLPGDGAAGFRRGVADFLDTLEGLDLHAASEDDALRLDLALTFRAGTRFAQPGPALSPSVVALLHGEPHFAAAASEGALTALRLLCEEWQVPAPFRERFDAWLAAQPAGPGRDILGYAGPSGFVGALHVNGAETALRAGVAAMEAAPRPEGTSGEPRLQALAVPRAAAYRLRLPEEGWLPDVLGIPVEIADVAARGDLLLLTGGSDPALTSTVLGEGAPSRLRKRLEDVKEPFFLMHLDGAAPGMALAPDVHWTAIGSRAGGRVHLRVWMRR